MGIMRMRRARTDWAGGWQRGSGPLLGWGFVALLTMAGCYACHHADHATGPTAAPAPEDPPTVRLYFLSDVAGALEPCGCVKDQLGGLDHAAAWMNSEKAHAPSSLLVTAGPTFFMNPVIDHDHISQDTAKAEAMAGALRGLGFAGWAPALNDWAAGASELTKLAQLSGAPSLGANLPPGGALLPTKIVAVNAVRVAFIGIATPHAAEADAGVKGDAAAGPPVAATTPEEAVKAAAAQARQDGAKLVIVLGSLGRGEAKRIADGVPDVTAVIVGDPSGSGEGNVPSPPGEQVGNVIIAETANHLQAVGVLDFFVRGDSYSFADGTGMADARRRVELAGRIDDLHVRIANWEKDKNIAAVDLDARRADLARLEAERVRLEARPPPAQGSYFRYSTKEVRDSLGEDPGVHASVIGYYRLVNDTNRVLLEGRFPPPAEPGQPTYVGIDTCKNCHASEKTFWDKTEHARAYATLTAQSKEFNLDCVGCHVTGYDRPGGSSVTHVDKLQDVQCEVCHGAGSLHAVSTSTKVPSPRPGPELCVACHHPPHVEGFDATVKMSAIIGPGHGR